MKYFKDSGVLRLKSNKLKIFWNIDDDIEVSIFSLIDNAEKIIGKVKGNSEFITDDVNKNKRNLFILKAENYHYEIVGERLIHLEGNGSLRDIGGYKSKDGRRIKWSLFYKSNKLSNLTHNDIKFIKDMKIKSILDLRSKEEVKGSRNSKIEGIKYFNLSAMKKYFINTFDFNMSSLFNNGNLDNIDVEKFILNSYRNMIFDNPALKKIIEFIENEDKVPMIFQCSSSKDRTELSSAIILAVLGVPKEVIKKEYIESNYYRKSINNIIIKKLEEKIKSREKLEILKYMLNVKEELIDIVFSEIDSKYGNFDIYLEKEYGLTRKKRKELKNRLLY